MAKDSQGRLIEELTSGNRPYLAIDKDKNARRVILIDQDGNEYIARGSIKQAWSGSGNVNMNFSTEVRTLSLKNDGAGDVTITINGITITIKSEESFYDDFEPFTAMSIVANSIYRAYVKD